MTGSKKAWEVPISWSASRAAKPKSQILGVVVYGKEGVLPAVVQRDRLVARARKHAERGRSEGRMVRGCPCSGIVGSRFAPSCRSADVTTTVLVPAVTSSPVIETTGGNNQRRTPRSPMGSSAPLWSRSTSCSPSSPRFRADRALADGGDEVEAMLEGGDRGHRILPPAPRSLTPSRRESRSCNGMRGGGGS